MKKTYIYLVFTLLLMILCFSATTALAAGGGITLMVNGEVIKTDADPFICNNVTMVPLRFASGPLEAQLVWDNINKQATMTRDGLSVVLTLDDKTALVNGESKTLLAAATAKNGRIFVPVRFIAENFGATVNWLKDTSVVQIQFPMVSTGLEVIGYYYDYNSLTMLRENGDSFNDVIHFAYSIDGSGNVNKKTNYDNDLFQCDACAILDELGIKRQALVSCFVTSVSDTLLSDPSLRAIAVANIVNMVNNDGYSGVDLDFEAVTSAQRDNFTALVKELKNSLGNKTLSLSLRARSYDSQTWLNGYDYAALSRYADKMIVMLYNQHYSGGAPGPVAGIDWMETTINYLLQYIPKEKFYAGLGAYGYSWLINGGGGTSIHIDRAYELAEKYGAVIQRDDISGVPWFKYTNDLGESRVLWFEDSASMAQKAALCKEYGLAGIAIWRMGIVPNDTWEAVTESLE